MQSLTFVTMATAMAAMLVLTAARPQLVGKSVVAATGPAEQVWPPIPYSFQYEIQDIETGNYQNRAEMKTETGDVFGSYSVMMPDGYIYTTTYNVTGSSGFISNLIRTLAEPAVFRAPVAESRTISDDSQGSEAQDSVTVTIADVASTADKKSNTVSAAESPVEKESVAVSGGKSLVEEVSRPIVFQPIAAVAQEDSVAKSLDVVEPEVPKTISQQVAEASSTVLSDASQS